MTREDAYYEQIKLLCGEWDSFEQWLNTYLEKEDPLSDIVLELLDCRGDIKEVERCLNLYCLEKPFDQESVHVRLRTELWEQYKKGVKAKDDVISTLFRISQKLPFCGFQNDCSALSDYYELAEMELIKMENFDKAFKKWLENGDGFSLDEMI